ncbi:pentapeptide repeat-containing protein [Chlorobium limicola]
MSAVYPFHHLAACPFSARHAERPATIACPGMNKYRSVLSIFLLAASCGSASTGYAADPEALRMLMNKRGEWEALRQSNPSLFVDLKKAKLDDANLKGANLSNVSLVRAELSGANLDKANLQRSDLSMAFIKKADLKETDLDESTLVKANLKNSFMKGASLRKANLQGANLRWAILENADLSQANLSGTVLFETSLQNANLKGSNFKGATFLDKADLNGALVSNNTIIPSGEKASGSWASLRNARFVREPESAPPVYAVRPEPDFLTAPAPQNPEQTVKPASQNRAKQQELLVADVESWNDMRQQNPEMPVVLKAEKLEDAELKGVNLKKAAMAGSDFEDANLDDAVMEDGDFSGSNFQKADMKGAKLHGAKLHKANFDRAFLKGADLSGTDLTGANLYGAMLSGANLRGANLTGASLFDADLEEADLSGAVLKDTSMMDANLNNAVITPETVLPSGKTATADWAVQRGAIFRKP